MNNRKTTVVALIALAVFGGGAWYFMSQQNVTGTPTLGVGSFSFGTGAAATPDGQVAVGSIVSPDAPVAAPQNLAQIYASDTYGFSLRYPEGYTQSSIPFTDENGDTVGETLLFNEANGNGVQIAISPFDEPVTVLDEARIRADIPDMKMEGVQPVPLGAAGQGVAFASDNDAFGGASREVWFVYKGHLFQISTYLKNDPLLQAMLGTFELK